MASNVLCKHGAVTTMAGCGTAYSRLELGPSPKPSLRPRTRDEPEASNQGRARGRATPGFRQVSCHMHGRRPRPPARSPRVPARPLPGFPQGFPRPPGFPPGGPPVGPHCAIATSLVGGNQTDAPAQPRNRCIHVGAMRGLGYGSRIERSVATSRLTYFPPAS